MARAARKLQAPLIPTMVQYWPLMLGPNVTAKFPAFHAHPQWPVALAGLGLRALLRFHPELDFLYRQDIPRLRVALASVGLDYWGVEMELFPFRSLSDQAVPTVGALPYAAKRKDEYARTAH